jgi:hypothetical protein
LRDVCLDRLQTERTNLCTVGDWCWRVRTQIVCPVIDIVTVTRVCEMQHCDELL